MATRKDKQPKSLRDLVRDAFKTPVGLQALDELMRVYVHRSSFDSDPLKMAYNEGMRSMVRNLYTMTHSRLEDLVDGNDDDAGTDDIFTE